MTFTYAPSTPTDRERVRFAIGDVDSTAAIFTDEEIAFMLSEYSTWKPAVIALLDGLIARMSTTPNFTADWLTVSVTDAVASFERLLARKRSEYGISQLTATTGYAWRPDSNQTAAPTFPEVD